MLKANNSGNYCFYRFFNLTIRASSLVCIGQLFVLLGIGGELAAAPTRGRGEREKITLQLKWHHQFQFAGYYAAQWKGFFHDEGLDVELVEGSSECSPLGRVLSGAADFGVSDADVLHARLSGSPIVVCAAIFQHSPYILMSRYDSDIRTPSDLLGRSVMISDDQGAVQFLYMLKREGLPMKKIRIVPHTWKLDDLVKGRVDAVSAYATAEPSQMRAMGIEPFVMKASDYGVDFYGDTLFTREEVVRERPRETAAMVRATRLGWHYAMEHPDEIIDRILELPGVKERGIGRQNLKFEAETMAGLIRADLVEIGHMSPTRWARMAKSYVETGLAPMPENSDWMEGFIYVGKDNRDTLLALGIGLASLSLVFFGIVGWNLSLRRQVEERIREIREGDELKRLILESAFNAVVGIDRTGAIVHWSPRAAIAFRIEEVDALGAPAARFLPGLEERLGSGQDDRPGRRFEIVATRADGSQFPAELSVSLLPGDRAVSLNVFVRDITEQRSLEEQLRQSQKMQAIGQLAGGVAHDFNNLLTVIQGNAALMRCEAGHPTGASESAHPTSEILAACERASSLTRQLLAFSRRQPMQTKVFRAEICLENSCRMLKRLIGEDIRLATDFESPSPLIRADQAMIEQVLLNLAVNGRDAMPRGGTLALSTRISPRPEGMKAAEADDYLQIDVRDTGVGIASEHLPHIFEPFFTTKEVGQGTGLGLATVFGIVEQHGGHVAVGSELGKGTCFSVWLPCLSAEAALGEAVAPAVGEDGRSTPGGRETILLVEDEEMVRVVARRILMKHGYRVLEAANGREALERWSESAEEIDLVLTDVVMPEGFSGHDLAMRLREDRVDLKIIYLSGYTAEIFRGTGALPEDTAFLGKPYRTEELLGTLRAVLDGTHEAVALPA